MIVDTGQHVGEVGLGVVAVHLGGLDEGHDTGERLGPGVGPGEQPVLTPDGNNPFILPMSAKIWRFIIVGIPISARK